MREILRFFMFLLYLDSGDILDVQLNKKAVCMVKQGGNPSLSRNG